VAVTYNLPELKRPLRLTPETPELLADLFLGRVARWNDERLREANPGVDLPDRAVTVVHRSDGSGHPVGIGAKGNEGVTGQVRLTPGSVGYVELVYAIQNGLPVARLRNREGNFVAPGVASVRAAADAAGTLPPARSRPSPISSSTATSRTGGGERSWRVSSGGRSTTVSRSTRACTTRPCRRRWWPASRRRCGS